MWISMHVNKQSSKHLNARTSNKTITYVSKPIDISWYTGVYMCVNIKYVNINACEQQAIIKVFEPEQVIIKASKHIRMMTYR